MKYEVQFTDICKFRLKHNEPITNDIPLLDIKAIVEDSDAIYHCADTTLYVFQLTGRDINNAFGIDVCDLEHFNEKHILDMFNLMTERKDYIKYKIIPQADEYAFYEDISNINDSLLIDSNTIIAEYIGKDYDASIEVRGEVKIIHNLDNGGMDIFKTPSDYPDWLKKSITEENLSERNDIYIDANNWFEVFIWDKEGNCITSDVVDCENNSFDQLAGIMTDFVDEFRKHRELDEQEIEI